MHFFIDFSHKKNMLFPRESRKEAFRKKFVHAMQKKRVFLIPKVKSHISGYVSLCTGYGRFYTGYGTQ